MSWASRYATCSATWIAAERGLVAFGDTGQLGVYRLSWLDREARFAVNLYSAQESDVRPASALPVDGIAAPADGEPPQQARREWWRPGAAAALALLVIEWLYYQRYAVVRVAAWFQRGVT